MKKECDIFICYRGNNNVLLPKLFAQYIEGINKDTSDKRNYGKVWFSDLETSGNYANEDELSSLISSAKYFVMFLFSGFTNGFFDERQQLNPKCITAKEFKVAEIVRQKRKNTDNELVFISANINGESFSEQDVANIRRLFELNGILKDDTLDAFTQLNKNNFDIRQGKEQEFFERLINGISPKIIGEIKYLTIDDVPEVSEDEIYSTVNKFIMRKTLLNGEWGDEISSEFFLLCLAKELNINDSNPQYLELLQRVSERLTEKIDTGDYKIEERHNKKVFAETEQIIELMQKDDLENGIFRNTPYAAKEIHNDIRFFYNYFDALFTKIRSLDDRFRKIAIQSEYTFTALFEKEAFEPFGGWKLYRLPWLTARVLLCLKDIALNDEQKKQVKLAVQSIIDRQDQDGTWYSGANDWVPIWESTGLCLEALFTYSKQKHASIIKKTLSHYLAELNELIDLINYSDDEDASNKSTAVIILLSVMYQVIKCCENDNADVLPIIRKALYLGLEQIQSTTVKSKQLSCVPCALYYMIKAVTTNEQNMG